MGKCFKNTQNKNFKKQIKKTIKTKLSLQLFLMANFDRVNRPIDMVRKKTKTKIIGKSVLIEFYK
jgi:hypothetical protein